MLHKQLEATVVEQDRGQFSAIAAAWSSDRQRERIVPGAFADTIKRWQASGKTLPLHFDHKAGADHVIGYIDPATMRETESGLYVEGKVDIRESDVGGEAWRSMKNRSMSVSIGYMVTDSRKGDDGIRELLSLDLYEISIVPPPANDETRILDTKSADIREEARAAMLAVALADAAPSLEELEQRAKALGIEEIARKSRPIRIATFEC